LFTLKIIPNTQIHSLGKIRIFYILKYVVHIVTAVL
jgi:hypothetical protein